MMKIKDYAITISVGIAAIILTSNILGDSCPFKQLVGIPCPGCGLTRAYISFLHGDIKIALSYHPLFWAVPFLGIPLLNPKKHKNMSDAIFSLTILAFIITWVYRVWNLDVFSFL